MLSRRETTDSVGTERGTTGQSIHGVAGSLGQNGSFLHRRQTHLASSLRGSRKEAAINKNVEPRHRRRMPRLSLRKPNRSVSAALP